MMRVDNGAVDAAAAATAHGGVFQVRIQLAVAIVIIFNYFLQVE